MNELRGMFFLFLSANFILCLAPSLSLASGPTFSLIWMTDTQYLSQTYPEYFDSACQWIVNNKDAYNVRLVVHTGDIVNTGTNLSQWQNANHSMGILLDNGVPYCWDAGNHDLMSGYWNGKSFTAFDVSVLKSKTYWEADCLDGRNTAVSFNVSEDNFLVVNIEYHANSTVLQWLNTILDAHADSHVVVATHAYLNETCGYGNDGWALGLRNGLLANHINVFMTLSGHYYSSSTANRTVVGNRLELFFDRQDIEGQKGGASLRILTFDLSQGKLDVRTYDTYAGKFLADSDSQFTMDLPFRTVPEFSENLFVALFVVVVTISLIYAGRSQNRKVKTRLSTVRGTFLSEPILLFVSACCSVQFLTKVF